MCLLYHESTQRELIKDSEEPYSTNSRKLKGTKGIIVFANFASVKGETQRVHPPCIKV